MNRVRAFLVSLLFSAPLSTSAAQTAIAVDLSKTYQTIQGLGSMVPSDDEITDLGVSAIRYGWDPEYNGGLERQNDNADVNSLDISKFTHTAASIASIKKAKAAGCSIVIASVWSPPTWMKDLSTNAYADQTQWQCPNIVGLCGGVLRADMYDEFAEWIEGCIVSFRQQAGFDLYAVGIQNEPGFAEPYGSCVYTAAQLRDVVKKVGARLRAKGITTRVLLPEDVIENWASLRGYIMTACADTSARRYISLLGFHGYAPDGINPGSIKPPAVLSLGTLAASYGKVLWMTETSGYPATPAGGLTVIYGMWSSLVYGNAVGWNYFGLSKSAGMVYYVHKNVFKYVKPGAIRIDAPSPDTAKVLSMAFKNFRDSTVTIVLVNRSSAAINATLTGAGLPSRFEVFTTSATQNCAANGTAAATNNHLTALPAQSVTTLRGSVPLAVRAPGRSALLIGAPGSAPAGLRSTDLCGRKIVRGLPTAVGIVVTSTVSRTSLRMSR